MKKPQLNIYRGTINTQFLRIERMSIDRHTHLKQGMRTREPQQKLQKKREKRNKTRRKTTTIQIQFNTLMIGE